MMIKFYRTSKGIDMREMYMSGNVGMTSPPMLRVLAYTDVFLDNSAPFEKFLRDNSESKARSCNGRVRPRNKIHTRVRCHIYASLQNLADKIGASSSASWSSSEQAANKSPRGNS